MKNEWKIEALGAVCTTIQDGAHESPKQQFDSPGEGRFLYITSKNIRTNYLDLGNVSYVERDFHDKIYPRCQPQVGDVLLTKDGANTGNVTLNTLDEPFSLLSSVCLIKTKPAALDPAFLCYYLQSPDGFKSIIGKMSGAAIKRIILRDVKLATIPLPALPEQRRLVGILDEAFEGIATAKANAEKNLQNARALFERHLQSVFIQRGEGWVLRTVSEIAKHSLGKMLDKAKNKGVPQAYLRNINVRWFTFDLSDLLEMPFLPGEAEKYTAIKGDVLICEGGYPGRAAIWDEDYPVYFQKALHRVRFHVPEHNKWFIHYLFAQDACGELKQHFNGTGIQHFTGEVLARFRIPLPPLPELRRAVARFEELRDETQRSIYQQKLAALEALKKSLLHRAFTGGL